MELITNILIEYLKHNKRIVVPKLGVFIVKQPSGIIRFSDLIRTDDGVLRSLIMAYGAKDIEADGMIDRFVFEIHHAIANGETYTIENFGEFTRGENNTTLFTHKNEPKVIGGRIKPPVESFEEEKRRILRTMGREDSSTPNEHVERREAPRAKRKKSNNDSGSIVKPDAYLRGLKYDKDKNKRRGEDGNKSRGNRGRVNLLTILLLLLLVGGIVFGLWQWRGGNGANTTVTKDTITTTDTTMLMMRDSSRVEQRDSSFVDTIEVKRENISSKNSYLNPKI